MSYAARVLCQPSVASGFRLAGLHPSEVSDPADGIRQLHALMEREENGLILVEDGIYAAIPDGTRRELARRPMPMVVPFPGPTWSVALEGPEGYIAALLRQAIGYRVRLR